MWRLVVYFLVFALAVGLVGFLVLDGVAQAVAHIAAGIFLVFALIALIAWMMSGSQPGGEPEN